MNEKNIVINNHAGSLLTFVSNLCAVLSGLGDDNTVNAGIIKTAYIDVTAINSQLVILQSELDKYEG